MNNDRSPDIFFDANKALKELVDYDGDDVYFSQWEVGFIENQSRKREEGKTGFSPKELKVLYDLHSRL